MLQIMKKYYKIACDHQRNNPRKLHYYEFLIDNLWTSSNITEIKRWYFPMA